MQIVYLDIDKLEPNENNPFPKIESKFFQKLCNSIKDNGLLQPLAVIKNEDRETYKILDGNHRFEALRTLGTIKEIPCIIVNQENLYDYIFDPNIYRRHLPNNAIDVYEHEKQQEETDLLINKLPHEILFLLENKKITKTEALRLARLPWKTLKDFVTTKLSTNEKNFDNEKIQQKIKTLENEIEQKERKMKELELQMKRTIEKIQEEFVDKAKEIAKEELEYEYEDKLEAVLKEKQKLQEELNDVAQEKSEIKKQIQTLQNILNNKDAVIQTLSEELDKQKTEKEEKLKTNPVIKEPSLFLFENIINTLLNSFNTLFNVVSDHPHSNNLKTALKKNKEKLKQAIERIDDVIDLVEE